MYQYVNMCMRMCVCVGVCVCVRVYVQTLSELSRCLENKAYCIFNLEESSSKWMPVRAGDWEPLLITQWLGTVTGIEWEEGRKAECPALYGTLSSDPELCHSKYIYPTEADEVEILETDNLGLNSGSTLFSSVIWGRHFNLSGFLFPHLYYEG